MTFMIISLAPLDCLVLYWGVCSLTPNEAHSKSPLTIDILAFGISILCF